jgi:hypothetical protein
MDPVIQTPAPAPEIAPAPPAVPAPVAPVTPAPVTPEAPPLVAPDLEPGEEVTPESKLSDEDLEKKIEAAATGKAPEPAPDKGTPKTETPAVSPATAPAAEPGKQPEKLLAGRYKTEADLEKGILELTKQMGIDDRGIRLELDIAKEFKNFSTIERLYTRMQSEWTKSKAAGAPRPAAPAPATDEKEFLQIVTQSTLEAMKSNATIEQMVEDGFTIPRTKQELDDLRKENFAWWKAFTDEFKRTFDEYSREGREYQKALDEVDSANTQAIEREITRIRQFVEANGLKLSDAEVEALKTEAIASPLVYEDRHGVQFIRDGGIYKYWLAEKFPEKLEELKVALVAKSRKEGITDLKALQSEGIRSISTSPIPGQRVEAPKIDEKNPDEVAKLSDEELAQRIEQKFKAA